MILNRSGTQSRRVGSLDWWIVLVFVKPRRLVRTAIAFKPSTLLNLHSVLIRRKYRLLFSPKQGAKPGPKWPDPNITRAVLQMKQRNPMWGCPRIAEQINLAFGTTINKDVVRRILARHSLQVPSDDGPSWLTFFGPEEGQLVLVVMDQYSRRIIGFGIQSESLMDWRFVACSNRQFVVRPFRNTSVQIMIHCIGFISGKQTCVFWMWQKSKQSVLTKNLVK